MSRKKNKTNKLHDKHCPHPSEYIPLPRLIYKKTHGITRGTFSWDFLYESLTLPPFLLYHTFMFPRQCLCASQLAQNWQQNGSLNLWKAFQRKDCWNPHEKVWYFDIGFSPEPGWKKQSIFLEKTQILLCEWESQDSLWKYICKERPPTEAKVVQCRKKKHE